MASMPGNIGLCKTLLHLAAIMKGYLDNTELLLVYLLYIAGCRTLSCVTSGSFEVLDPVYINGLTATVDHIKHKSDPLQPSHYLQSQNPSTMTLPEKAVDVIVISSVFPALAALSLVARIWSRRIKSLKLRLNDYAIIAAAVREDQA